MHRASRHLHPRTSSRLKRRYWRRLIRGVRKSLCLPRVHSYSRICNEPMQFLAFIGMSKSRLAALMALFTALGLTLPVARTFSAQKSRRHRSAARKPIAGAFSVHDCGQGITLRLGAPESAQGSLLLLELHSSAHPLGEEK